MQSPPTSRPKYATRTYEGRRKVKRILIDDLPSINPPSKQSERVKVFTDGSTPVQRVLADRTLQKGILRTNRGIFGGMTRSVDTTRVSFINSSPTQCLYPNGDPTSKNISCSSPIFTSTVLLDQN